MNILAVDDERLALAALVAAIEEADPRASVSGYRSAADALASLGDHAYDVAFLDIELRDGSGMALAEQLRRAAPELRIVFVTGYSQYAVDAFALHADGYVMKPVDPARIAEELERLRGGIEARAAGLAAGSDADSRAGVAPAAPRLRIQCLGNFEVFLDGHPLSFGRTKTKELLAYLVDRRGAMCTNGELMVALWEDDDHEPYLRQLKKDLVDTFEAAGCPDALVRKRGGIGLVTSKVSCDYYDLLAGGNTHARDFRGEYMEQYSWAEATKARL